MHRQHNHSHSHSPHSTMSDFVREMQERIDEHKEALGDGAYVSLSDGLKELFAATILFKVCYIKFEADLEQIANVGVVISTERMCIMPKKDLVVGLKGPCWTTVFRYNELPNDMTNCVLNKPFHGENGRDLCMVTSVEPYLKRSREEADEDSE